MSSAGATPPGTPLAPWTAATPTTAERRLSSRSHKRKKFDDEVVESSLAGGSRRKNKEATGGAGSGGHSVVAAPGGPAAAVASPRRGSRESADTPVRTWPENDDFLLIHNLIQVADISLVHQCVSFSRAYTIEELRLRWAQLLLDAPCSRVACARMARIDTATKRRLQATLLWSPEEENLLRTLLPDGGGSCPSLKTCQTLLNENPEAFALERTASAVQKHWKRMQAFGLLTPDTCALGKMDGGTAPVQSFGDATAESLAQVHDRQEALVLSKKLREELEHMDRKNKRKIIRLERRLEQPLPFEGPKLPILVDATALAEFRGLRSCFAMRSRHVILGRKCSDTDVDIDLSEECDAQYISRQQCEVKLKADGYFCMRNLGKKTMYINAVPLNPGSKTRLFNNCVIELRELRLLFLVNETLLRDILADVIN